MAKKSAVRNYFGKLFSNSFFWIMLVAFIVSLLYNCIVNKECIKEGFEASADTFKTDVGSGKKLVLFYADWCGHCKRIHPEWDKAAKKVNGDTIKMAKVNCGDKKNSKHSEIAKEYKVNGYPTIHLLNDGKIEDTYSGERSASGFAKYIDDN